MLYFLSKIGKVKILLFDIFECHDQANISLIGYMNSVLWRLVKHIVKVFMTLPILGKTKCPLESGKLYFVFPWVE